MAVTCVVGASQAWLPFSDPVVDESSFLECFQSRISVEITRQTPPWNLTFFEQHPHHLLRILRRCNYNMEQAVHEWKEWVIWRHEQRIGEITDDVIRCDVDGELIKWQGHDKKGRLCCVVTGRHMNPDGRRSKGGTGLSFQKYLIRTVEDGCRLAMEQSSAMNATDASSSASSGPPSQYRIDRDDTATTSDTSSRLDASPGLGASPDLDAGPDFCIVYDRRGLDWHHIDPMLYKLSRNTIDALRTHYGCRVGMIYILHTNWIYRALFATIVRPFLALFSSRGYDRFVVVQSPEDLHAYFDIDQLHLTDPI